MSAPEPAAQTADTAAGSATGPWILAEVSTETLWPANHELANVGLLVVVTDLSGPRPSVSIETWSDEPKDDVGDGHTTPDAVIEGSRLLLRSERRGNGDGRVYLIKATTPAASGEPVFACQTVTVTHSQSKASRESVRLQAERARLTCETTGAAPEGFFPLASGPYATSGPPRPVHPIPECVTDLGYGVVRGVFGYLNENPIPVVIPVGANNRFEPGPADRGQTSFFLSGRSPGSQGAFVADFEGEAVTWYLNALAATVSRASTRCSAAPATPDARDDEASTPADTAAAIDVLANDVDPQDDPLSIVRFAQGEHGQVAQDGSGHLVYTPQSGFSGSDSFRYTVWDGAYGTDQAQVTVTVEPVVQNQAPVVDAGPDETLVLPAATALLQGSVTDDGRPQGSVLSIEWSMVSGPGTVVFGDASSPVTSAAFSAIGDYVLRLTASDGELQGTDEVHVIVAPPPLPSISVEDASVVEGPPGALPEASVVLRLSAPADHEVTVGLKTLDGTTVAGCDYRSGARTVTFAPGQTEVAVSVVVYGDLAVEQDETVLVQLGDPLGATLGRSEATVSIVNDDVPNSRPFPIGARTPADGALEVAPTASLLWTGGDPDPADTVTYDVQLGTEASTDGQAWEPTCPAGEAAGVSPDAAAAYDADGDRLVVVEPSGGGVVRVLHNALGAGGRPEWTSLTPGGASPPPQPDATAVYDPLANRLVLHGGCGADCASPSVSAWLLTEANGEGATPAWIQLPDAPVGRVGHVAGYDPDGRRMVVFGGFDGASLRSDVALLLDANADGTPTWTSLAVAGEQPSPRRDAAGVYDPRTNRLFVFGGEGADGSVLGDLWVLEYANGLGGIPAWRAVEAPAAAPAPRSGARVAYEPALDRLILFGGTTAGVDTNTNFVFNDVWLFDGAGGAPGGSWQRLAPDGDGVTPRYSAVTAYSASDNRVLLTGGRNNKLGTPSRAFVLTDAFGRLPQVATGQTDTSFSPGVLAAGTRHLWRVVARDTQGAATGSEVLSFVADLPQLNVADTAFIEGDGETRTVEVQLRLSRASDEDVSVNVATADGTATAGADYLPLSAAVRFAPGETGKALSLTVIGDRLIEGVESFLVRLSSPTAARLGRAEAEVRIEDDDHPVPPLADVVARTLDLSAFTVDGQSLAVSGLLRAGLENLGGQPTGPFEVFFYEDRDGDAAFTTGVDALLGATTVGELLPGQAQAEVAATGMLLFPGNTIHVFADATERVAESDEANNHASSQPPCTPRTGSLGFPARREAVWNTPTTLPAKNEVIMTPLVIDLDGDRLPEIVFTSYAGNYSVDGHLRAVRGRDMSERFTVTDPAFDLVPGMPLAAGDLDGDGRPEIVGIHESQQRLIVFGSDGAVKSMSAVLPQTAATPYIGDVDGDGRPEVLSGRMLLNPDLSLRWVATAGYAGPSGSIMVDLDRDGIQEVVSGNTAYNANGSVRWSNAAVDNGSSAAAANLDGDPEPEIVIVGSGRVWVLEHTGTVKWGPVAVDGSGAPPTLADVNGDGQAEIVVSGKTRLQTLSRTGAFLWTTPVHDDSTGPLGSSAFDFDGDGAFEVVNSDEFYLRVVNGRNGAVLFQTAVGSGSGIEYPVVADIDGDGNAEIVAVGNRSVWGNSRPGIHVFGGAVDAWLATRPIWNQYAYQPATVEDDGRIPAHPSPEGPNVFRGQVLLGGCAYAQADLSASNVRIDVTGGERRVVARVGNAGFRVAAVGVFVSFYDGDPRTSGRRLGTVATSRDLPPGGYEDVSLVVAETETTSQSVWVAADDLGGLRGLLAEPDETNNLHESGLALVSPAGLPDLTASDVDAAALSVDSRTGEISGVLRATLRNQGEAPSGAFVAAAFEDRDGDGQFAPAADGLLGWAAVPGLAAGESAQVEVTVAGSLAFTSAPVFVLADSEAAVLESNESNNLARSGETCSVCPPTAAFAPRLERSFSTFGVAPGSRNVRMTPVVADLEGDGSAEIVFVTSAGSNDGLLRAVRVRDGQLLFTVTNPDLALNPQANVAVGDIDGDPGPEIVGLLAPAGSGIVAFDPNGALKWKISAPELYGDASPALADLNGDGIAEIVLGRHVFRGTDGSVLPGWPGSAGDGRNYYMGPNTIVADIDEDGSPEVLAGDTAYRSSGAVLWRDPTNLQAAGYNAVADFDLDGLTEVVRVATGTVALLDRSGRVRWTRVLPGDGQGTVPAVADFDADGRMEIAVAGASWVHVLRDDGLVKWSVRTAATDGVTGLALGATSPTAFDFDGDGAFEVVHSDPARLRIYRGRDGYLLWETPLENFVHTLRQPVIADVDGDGKAEILATASSSSTTGRKGIYVFGDGNDNWVGSRAAWNQFSYHITNVNDDDTVPAVERRSWEDRNTYRANEQTAGNRFGAPDLTASRVERRIAGGAVELVARVGNGGYGRVLAGLPVSFYDGDPRVGGTLLGTLTTSVALDPGQYEDVVLSLPGDTGSESSVWVVADDAGGLQGTRSECNEANNLADSGLYLNRAPVVNAGLDQGLGLPTASATLLGEVTDDDLPAGSSVTSLWTVDSQPAGGSVTFGDPTAAVTTAEFTGTGSFVLRLTATDGVLEASDVVTVTVHPENQAPAVAAGPDQGITLPPQDAIALTGTVTDDGLPLGSELTVVWSAPVVPAGGSVSFGDPAAAATMARFTSAGVYVLRLTASDGTLSAFDEVAVTVLAGNRPPVVSAGPDGVITLPATTIGLTGTATDDGLPAGSTVGVAWSQVSGPAPVTFTPPDALATAASFGAAGSYVLRLTATDGVLASSDDVTVVVQPGPAVGDPPFVVIISPSEGAAVTEPVDITGSVASDSLLVWKLQYRRTGDSGPFTMLSQGDTPTSGVIARFDPTLLLNGQYDVQFVATDTADRTAATAFTAVVKENLKVGNFTVSFTDLEVPVAGMPIRVTRTYDSRDRGSVGDFGFGWRVDLSNVRVQENAVAGLAWEGTKLPGFFPTYCLQASRPQVVTVTTPDGRVFEFEPVLTPSCQQFAPIEVATLSFRPVPGTTTLGTLRPANDARVIVVGSWPGPMQLFGELDFSIFDPDAYALTLPDGREMSLDQAAGLTRLLDLNGNRLEVGPAGITYANASVPGSTKGIVFTRDAQGRIAAITDPDGKSLTYAYDATGDLVSVTDREESATTLTYLAAVPHLLDEIRDPLGRTPIKNEYDTAGRLVAHTDAFGKRIEYTHSIGTRQEIVKDRNDQIRVLEYDSRGNVVKEVQPDGRQILRSFDGRNNRASETEPHEPSNPSPPTTRYVYDAQDNLLSTTDPENNTTEYTYNARKQVLTTKDARGKYTVNAYDAKGNLLSTKSGGTSATGPFLSETGQSYDASGNLLTQTTTVGGVVQTTSYVYDGFGNLTRETDAAGHVTTYTYDGRGNRLTQATTRTLLSCMSDPPPVCTSSGTETLTTRYEYDRNGRLTKTTDPDGTFTRTVYDALGRQKETYDKKDRKTAYEYDEMERLTKTTYADLTTEESTYDNEGRRLTSKDRGGRTTSYLYDDLGRLKKTTFPDTTFTENVYDAAGRLTATKDARGKTTAYEYDAAGRRTKVKDPLNNETVFTYDSSGNQRTVKDARLNTTTYEYDDINRRTKTLFPDGTFTETTYDELGRRTSEKDQAGKVTQFRYDALGRLTKVIDALSQETLYGYDEAGNRISQTDANGHTTWFLFDKLGRETARILPDGSRETKTYDAAGNLETRTDFLGRTTTYAYDDNNRLTSRSYPNPAENVSFTYTPTGRRLTATDARGTTDYGYDVRDRLISLAQPGVGSLGYGYDGNGNRTSLTATVNGTSHTTSYSYDDASRLDIVTDPAGRTYDFTHDPNGNRQGLVYPNSTSTSYTYNALNRLTNLTTTGPLGTVQGYAFTLGPAGNRTRIDEADGTIRDYTYDDLYRLTGEMVTIGSLLQYGRVFTYDPVGNRRQQTTTLGPAGSPGLNLQPGTIDYGYDTRDRLLAEALAGGTTTNYAFDTNGNLTSKDGEATYTWDRENRLIRVQKAEGTLVEYTYDPDGNRASTTTTPAGGGATTTTAYLVDTSGSLSHVVAEVDATTLATPTLTALYIRGSDDLLSVMRPLVPPPATPTDWQTRYYHADGIGSIRRLTNEPGTITDGYSYFAFGELLSHTGTDPQPYSFAGEPLDPKSGWQYHRARWMDPRVGRFVSVDPFAGNTFDPPSLHRYLYTHANPVSNTDPTGRFTLSSLATVSAVLNTINTISLLSTAAVFGYRAGTIANDLLIEEKIELEDALEQAADLGGDIALSTAGYRLLNFEGLKFAGSLMRKLPAMVGRIKLWNVAHVNGRLAEHYIGNAYGLFRNNLPIPSGRVPDFLTNSVLRELKNVIRLRWTQQLADMADFCVATGRKYYLHVRPGTQIAAKVESELLARFGPGSKGVLWDIVTDIPEALRVIP